MSSTLQPIDWFIIVAPWVIILGIGILTRRSMKSVVDFLAAGRGAGRYLMTVAEGVAGMGLITAVAIFEASYRAGPAFNWFMQLAQPVTMVVTLTGFIIYRYRRTRVMTMAQFFESRYSKRFRIYMGLLAWVAGVINYGIFPAVGARFLVYYAGLPERMTILGQAVPTFAAVMLIFLALAMVFVWMGGQLQILVTDAVQGIFCGILLLCIGFALLQIFSFETLFQGLTNRPPGESMLNPFDTGAVKDFNVWYVLIGLFSMVYSFMAWPGGQGFNASALNPHEAKMGKIIAVWRACGQGLAMTIIAFGAIAFMRLPEFAEGAAAAKAALAQIDNPAIRTQMTVPVAAAHFLPVGISGMFVAVMLFWMVTTDTSYLHSWGTVLIQDVVLPLRRTPLPPALHLRLMRWSMLFVAVFAFCFSLLFNQTTYIYMFFAFTGTLYLGGAGAAIIGGLYWKKGTAAGAWAGSLIGSGLGLIGLLLDQPAMWNRLSDLLRAIGFAPETAAALPAKFPLNGQVTYFIAMATAVTAYVVVSLLTCRENFNMDRLLHRGPYAVQEDQVSVAPAPVRGWRRLKEFFFGWDDEFTRGDKILSVALFGYSMFFFLGFVVITIWNLVTPWPERWWWNWQCVSLYLGIVLAAPTTIWFTWGGTRDLLRLFRRLKSVARDEHDNGTVYREEQKT
jgi:SSS family solute:Na+ symporter